MNKPKSLIWSKSFSNMQLFTIFCGAELQEGSAQAKNSSLKS